MSRTSIGHAVGVIGVVLMFGSALYVRHLARTKGGPDYLYTFRGNLRFYRESWRELKVPMLVTCLSILMLVVATRMQ